MHPTRAEGRATWRQERDADGRLLERRDHAATFISRLLQQPGMVWGGKVRVQLALEDFTAVAL